MGFKNVVIAGGGVLGSQIAFQAAYWGKDVTIWLRSESSISRTRPKIEALKAEYEKAIHLMEKSRSVSIWCNGISKVDSFDPKVCLKRVADAYKRIKLELDIHKACADADIVIESMAEIAKEKTAFYKKLAPVLPEKTVLVTNSSTLLPSKFAAVTKRPQKYLSLHFANHIWKQNIAEIMSHDKTDKQYVDQVVAFAKEIGMEPVLVNKEKAGYLLNSLLVPFLLCAMDLYANGVSDPASIDKAWKISTSSPQGPFEILDIVGLETAANICEKYVSVPGFISPLLKKMMFPYNFKGMLKIVRDKIAQGKTGKAAGVGFYKYSSK